ncbi:putative SH3 domain-containing protein [Seiridium unicorne]|uniref:SH3 domain-containing protein n=1 Tax=Seiridium unicorne TaxID=138068 RepID=A0ABR2UV83_9PEZI
MMAVEVEDLLVQPFRELINRGNEAITNAEAARPGNLELAQAMLKSARAVVREGDRALQRVEPLILGHLERHGDAFRDAIRECDEIFESQRQVEDVLYDIDDYIEADTFDAAKFSQLQAASKAFALCAIENIRRLRIGDIPLSPTTFPPLPPLPQTRPSRVEPLTISRPGTRTGLYGMEQYVVSPQAASAPQIGHSRRALSTSLRSSPGEGHMIRRMSTKKSQKSLTPSTSSSDSHYSQASFQWSTPSESRGYHSHQLSDVEALGEDIQNMMSEPSSPKFAENRSTMPTASAPWTNAWVHDQLSSSREPSIQETIHEDFPTGRSSHESRESAAKRYTIESDTLADMVFQPPNHSSRPQRASMFSSPNSHLSYLRRPSEIPTTEQRITTPASPIYESPGRPSMEILSSTLVSSGSVRGSPIHEPLVQEVSTPEPTRTEFAAPQAPVYMQTTVPEPVKTKPKAKARVAADEYPKPVWYSREENCSIGPDSTLYQLKSFCEGSLAFKNGRYQEATKTAIFIDTGAVAATSAAYHDSMTSTALALGASQPMSFGARKTVAQCISCEYSHSAAEFRRDMARDKRGNATMESVNYRLRFLYKSHLAADNRSNTLYGCIFCAHLGYTSREGDATVFTTERQLFRHLSHHPQPLPQVPGLTVLYGYLGSNCTQAEDYDLHFPSPQFASPIIPEAPLLTKRPTAIALQNQLQKEGSKPATDPDGRRDVLQFLTGARIVGVEFPDAWGGKWCTGWHDGVRGAFPAKLVNVEAPPKSDIRLPGTNNDGVVVTARWKWEPKDVDGGWLIFDKNTTITNVSWLSYDSWCWSGMTKDGKTGIFPSSHIKADSIRDPSGAHGSSLTKKESRRLFKIRHAKSNSSSSITY